MINKFGEFKKGDFVVLLLDASGYKCDGGGMNIDYIYRLRKDVTPFCFEVEIDTIGYEGSGWSTSSRSASDEFRYKMRKASFKEVEAYIRNGYKPCKAIADETQLNIIDNLNELSELLKKMKKLKTN